MKTKFYICRHCGNIITKFKDSGVAVVCCGDKMEELTANTVEASAEKHLPAVTVSGDTVSVNVGSVDHPMLPEHSIQWIFAETENGGQIKYLNPGDTPHAEFTLAGDKAVGVFEYCNLHGLWLTEL